MSQRICLIFLLFLTLPTGSFAQPLAPDEQYGDLFAEVQTRMIFPDSKTFADCVPKFPAPVILKSYEKARQTRGFSLKSFVEQHFTVPTLPTPARKVRPTGSAQQTLTSLWPLLTRQSGDRADAGSLITLPNPYVTTDGRSGELPYWDSYFTMLGLQASGQTALMRHMVDNFAYLIRTVGHVPSSNRTYCLSRSQPPVFSLMVGLLSETRGRRVLVTYLPALQQEYNFWMDGRDKTTEEAPAYRRVVRMASGVFLNRYYDDRDTPRPEAYREDMALVKNRKDAPALYRNLRAGAESGWTFSSRWLKDSKVLRSIHTTDLIPVDLNCLLLNLERTLAEGYRLKGDKRRMRMYQIQAQKRHDAIQQYCWNDRRRFYFDYDFVDQKTTSVYSAAAALPLFVRIATLDQARYVGQTLQRDFLKAGGLLATTTSRTSQVWDSPNGYASVQWFAIQGLRNYNLTEPASQIKRNWQAETLKAYKATGTFLSVYNVVGSRSSGDKDLPIPDGYGPTNGVLLRLLKEDALLSPPDRSLAQ
ncbi:alpha,alpha-trehalase TreF [Spirosoma utsteinense]|uniref:Alpha,alpha-trehalase n=1 Tax=Spirosoma utsteinense TaxID=2585773 RepID=A0ABR6W576_9BACT|nr:alpha,alpha-trehalase TreF [Spirosoma utsteinense]MBC3785600.1 alpha,alpha-trehalase [Spirosoma utsteinense]MBC3791750.1 alpha,alpha-trehalase [Spirosoma utsteinense]